MTVDRKATGVLSIAAFFVAMGLAAGACAQQLTTQPFMTRPLMAQSGTDPAVATPPVSTMTLAGSAASTILGRSVFEPSGDNVGLLVDIVVDNDGIPMAGVIDIGGFLGLGARRVAVAWRLFHIVREGTDVRLTMDLAFDSAASAPEFRGPDDTLIVIDRVP